MEVPSDFVKRHEWLCERLRDARASRLPDRATPEGKAILEQLGQWLHLEPQSGWQFYEIMSDGGGQAEPYWHGLFGGPSAYRVLSAQERDDLAQRIAEERHKHRTDFRLTPRRIVTWDASFRSLWPFVSRGGGEGG